MPSWLLFVLLVLACYRTWRLIGKDDITQPLRRPLPDFVRKGVECPWCAGTWLALVGVFLTHHFVVELAPHWLLWAAGVACGVGLLYQADNE